MIVRRLAPCLLLLLGLALSGTAARDADATGAAIGGRVIVAPDAAPWQAVGRLNVAGFRIRRHCTATLVAPDLALTARHCLGGFRGEEWVAPDLVHFLPGYSRGGYIEHRQAVGYEPVGNEAVLVRLDGPAMIASVPIARRGTVPGTALFQAGYSRDKGQVLTVDPACRFLGWSDDGLWNHDCEAIGGDSGAPILIDTGAGLAVAAIHVGRRGSVGLAEPLDPERMPRLARR
ncbi:trypsin-like peptidase domain-containing protein [Thalassobaculum sp.]|uniref:trypsin-like serine peptidase n=1 Tax=Thalassobaculum sp. TaxID=2022740 RepID=UPI0032EC9FC5